MWSVLFRRRNVLKSLELQMGFASVKEYMDKKRPNRVIEERLEISPLYFFVRYLWIALFASLITLINDRCSRRRDHFLVRCLDFGDFATA